MSWVSALFCKTNPPPFYASVDWSILRLFAEQDDVPVPAKNSLLILSFYNRFLIILKTYKKEILGYLESFAEQDDAHVPAKNSMIILKYYNWFLMILKNLKKEILGYLGLFPPLPFISIW